MTRTLEHVADGDWNTVRRNFEQTDQRLSPPVPQARVFNSAAISIVTSGTRQFLTFDTERWDNGDLHSTTTNTGRLTAPIAGLYEINCTVEFASNATGYREVAVRLNGATFIAAQRWPAVNGASTVMTCPVQYQLAAADYVELGVTQTSGGALNVSASGNFSPEFWMHRVSGYTNAGVG